MGFFGGLTIEISGIVPERSQAIIAAVSEWTCQDGWTMSGDSMSYIGDHKISYDLWFENERARVARAVWKANGGCCAISIEVANYDQSPWQSSEFGEADFEMLMRNRRSHQPIDTNGLGQLVFECLRKEDGEP